MEKKKPSDREVTAYHEVGHALVAYLVGCYADGCSLKATESYRGYSLRSLTLRRFLRGAVNFNPEERPSDELQLPQQLAHLYAGVVAQRLLCMQCGVDPEPIRPGHHSHDDIRIAQGMVNHLPEAERLELLASAEKRAMDMLSDSHNWQTLEKIAAILLEVEELDGPSMNELLSEFLDFLL